MPIDPSIALQLKNPPLESPVNQMAKIYEIKQAQQANELNRLKMDEYTRGVQEQELFKNQLRGAGSDEEAIKNAFFSKGDVEGYTKYLKSKGDIKKTETETSKTQLEATQAKLNLMGQAFGHVRNNPTVENAIMALDYLANNNVIDAAQLEKEKADILSNPDPARIKQLADQGFTAALSAKDQLPKIESQDLGGKTRMLSVSPVTGMATTVEGSEAAKTVTPGEMLSATTTRRGQDLTNARELQRIEIEKGKNSPEAIAMRAKMTELGKAEAKFEANAPQAITTAKTALTKIDEMLAHPGLAPAVGAGGLSTLGIPGIAQYIPGSEAASFKARLDEILGGAFMEAFNTLKGGGQITEKEGEKATAAITRLSTMQSEKEFRQAAKDFQEVINAGIKRSEAKLAKSGGAAASASPDVDTTNPLLQ